MTEESKEKIVARIMKLMELGREDKNSNPHERESATRMAARLMAEYSIDFVDLRNGKPSESVFVTFKIDGSADEKVDFEAALANSIAKAFDCKVINSDRSGHWQLHFCGTKHDLEIVVYFYKYLRRTLYAMAELNVTAENVRGRKDRATPAEVRQAQRNYCYGLVTTISVRLEELYVKREEFIPSDCRELVVVKKQGLEDYYQNQYPNARNARRRMLTGDMRAYDRGVVDGRSIQLNRAVSGNGAASAQIQ